MTVYPSTEMRIICPYCEAKGKITKDSPPHRDFVISCPKCAQRFTIHLNRRLFYRKKVNIEASYQIQAVNRPPRKGNILDISISGLCFKCFKSAFEKIGNILVLTFILPPREEPIRVNGKIVRIIEETDKTITMGLRLKNPGEYEEMEIGFFLKP
ncbi:MAG: PilZ domain-containing protein [Candidatus Magnetominusculus sp. LBB02]|nr:PilZ domain-containing protein [Candidatus Magnetominusculus sp. LBB02]